MFVHTYGCISKDIDKDEQGVDFQNQRVILGKRKRTYRQSNKRIYSLNSPFIFCKQDFTHSGLMKNTAIAITVDVWKRVSETSEVII